ncbi:MAG: M56 family metallopeptidase [Bacteroidia bacterium]
MTTLFHHPVLMAMGEALLHSLWQGFVIFILLRLMLYIFRNESSAMKYVMSALALAAIFISFAITFFICTSPAIIVDSESVNSSPTFLITTLPVSHAIESSSWNDIVDLNKVIENFLPFYFIGMIFLILKITVSYFKMQTLRMNGIVEIDAWQQNFEILIQRFNLSANIKIFFSEHVDAPMMMGFFKPTILLPIAIINNLSIEQVEAIIMHELAHVKRNDYIINIMQNIIEAIFFFNPFVWIISNEIRMERENSCDDLVLKNQNNPVNYAEALYALECNRFNSYRLSLGAANNKNHLLKRIRRIMETRNTKITRSKVMLGACLVILSFISIAWLVPQDTVQNKKVTKSTKATIAKPPVPPAPPVELAAPPVLPVVAPGSIDEIAPPVEIPEIPVVPAQPPMPPDSSKNANHHITFIDDDGTVRQYKSYDDIPEADKRKIEAEMEKAHIGMERAKEQMKKSHEEMERVHEQIKKMDFEKMDREMKKAQKEYEHAMKNVDMKKMQAELEMANASMQKLNSEEMKKEMDELMKARDLRKLEMDEMKRDLANDVNRDLQKELKLAMIEKEKAAEAERLAITKRNITEENLYKMITEMESEKLISRKAGFVIQKINGELFINNEKQSEVTNEKYSKYIGSKDIKVKGKNDDVQISTGKSENDD